MMVRVTVTKEEQKAIKSLKRLAKKWPRGLSLFSWSGSLHVFKHVGIMCADICTVDGISNDGGDPGHGDGHILPFDTDIDYE